MGAVCSGKRPQTSDHEDIEPAPVRKGNRVSKNAVDIQCIEVDDMRSDFVQVEDHVNAVTSVVPIAGERTHKLPEKYPEENEKKKKEEKITKKREPTPRAVTLITTAVEAEPAEIQIFDATKEVVSEKRTPDNVSSSSKNFAEDLKEDMKKKRDPAKRERAPSIPASMPAPPPDSVLQEEEFKPSSVRSTQQHERPSSTRSDISEFDSVGEMFAAELDEKMLSIDVKERGSEENMESVPTPFNSPQLTEQVNQVGDDVPPTQTKFEIFKNEAEIAELFADVGDDNAAVLLFSEDLSDDDDGGDVAHLFDNAEEVKEDIPAEKASKDAEAEEEVEAAEIPIVVAVAEDSPAKAVEVEKEPEEPSPPAENEPEPEVTTTTEPDATKKETTVKAPPQEEEEDVFEFDEPDESAEAQVVINIAHNSITEVGTPTHIEKNPNEKIGDQINALNDEIGRLEDDKDNFPGKRNKKKRKTINRKIAKLKSEIEKLESSKVPLKDDVFYLDSNKSEEISKKRAPETKEDAPASGLQAVENEKDEAAEKSSDGFVNVSPKSKVEDIASEPVVLPNPIDHVEEVRDREPSPQMKLFLVSEDGRESVRLHPAEISSLQELVKEDYSPSLGEIDEVDRERDMETMSSPRQYHDMYKDPRTGKWTVKRQSMADQSLAKEEELEDIRRVMRASRSLDKIASHELLEVERRSREKSLSPSPRRSRSKSPLIQRLSAKFQNPSVV